MELYCNKCGKEVTPGANFCPHCGAPAVAGQDAQVVAEKPKKKSSPMRTVFILLLLVLIGYCFNVCFSSYSESVEYQAAHSELYNKSAPTPVVDNTPKLRLESWNWSEEYDYVTVKGQVTNISDSPIKNVEALATFYSADGTFITSDATLIDYNPILPGQTSPFHVMEKFNPAMKKASVSFKQLMGGEIVSTVAEKKKK